LKKENEYEKYGETHCKVVPSNVGIKVGGRKFGLVGEC